MMKFSPDLGVRVPVYVLFVNYAFHADGQDICKKLNVQRRIMPNISSPKNTFFGRTEREIRVLSHTVPQIYNIGKSIIDDLCLDDMSLTSALDINGPSSKINNYSDCQVEKYNLSAKKNLNR